jgi:hypothetical protein
MTSLLSWITRLTKKRAETRPALASDAPFAPALIETDMVTSNPNANPNLISMGRFGSADDVASVAVMLAI